MSPLSSLSISSLFFLPSLFSPSSLFSLSLWEPPPPTEVTPSLSSSPSPTERTNLASAPAASANRRTVLLGRPSSSQCVAHLSLSSSRSALPSELEEEEATRLVQALRRSPTSPQRRLRVDRTAAVAACCRTADPSAAAADRDRDLEVPWPVRSPLDQAAGQAVAQRSGTLAPDLEVASPMDRDRPLSRCSSRWVPAVVPSPLSSMRSRRSLSSRLAVGEGSPRLSDRGSMGLWEEMDLVDLADLGRGQEEALRATLAGQIRCR